MRLGMPYKVVGGTRFYDRREVKDAIAYLRAVVNPSDEVSLKRIVNVPKRGVGDTSIGRLDAWAAAHGATFPDAVRAGEQAGLSGKALSGVHQLNGLLDELRELNAESGPATVLERILDAHRLRRRAGGRSQHRVAGPAGEPGRARRATPASTRAPTSSSRR